MSTTGLAPQDTYTVTVDRASYSLTANDSIRISNLESGEHLVALSAGLDCRVDNPVRRVSFGVSASAHFAVTCVGTGKASTFVYNLGASPYGDHFVEFELGQPLTRLVANGTMEAELTVGRYWPWLYPAPNCQAEGYTFPIDVHLGETTELTFVVSCVPAGTVGATVSVSGWDVPESFDVSLRGGVGAEAKVLTVPANGTATDMLLAGDWNGELALPDHCTATSNNPMPFTMTEGQVVDLDFDVTCVRYTGTLRVSMTTTGSRQHGVVLSINGGCPDPTDPDSWDCIWLPMNGAWSLDLPPGTYALQLYANTSCAISPASFAVADVTVGVTTDLAFAQSCD